MSMPTIPSKHSTPRPSTFKTWLGEFERMGRVKIKKKEGVREGSWVRRGKWG